MKRIVLMIVIMLVTALPAWSMERDIDSRAVKALLDKNRNVYLLDVRSPQEYSQGKLAGSVLIPVGELKRRFGEVPKNKPVVVYCASGSRSKIAASFLAQQGYTDVFNMSDGIVGWYRNGLPVNR